MSFSSWLSERTGLSLSKIAFLHWPSTVFSRISLPTTWYLAALVIALTVAGCGTTASQVEAAGVPRAIEVTRVVEVTRIAEVTREVVVTPTSQPALPTATTAPQPSAIAIPTAEPTSAPLPTPSGPIANTNANLRSGPGTAYEIVGSTAPGQTVEIIATNSDGSWYQLVDGGWIAASLVDNSPVGIPIAADIPEPTPIPTQETANAAVPQAEPEKSPSIKQIGEEVEGNGWKFTVAEVHKRKALYWGNDSVIAFGHFLVVVIDDMNMQSGTDYFARNLVPWIADDVAEEYLDNRKGTLYATWQFGGLGSMFSDLNPGVWGKIVIVYDLPDDIGHIMLSTAIPAWVDLGDFSTMAVEE